LAKENINGASGHSILVLPNFKPFQGMYPSIIMEKKKKKSEAIITNLGIR
jgi:hypothetical protein